jgi:hypothetical protein
MTARWWAPCRWPAPTTSRRRSGRRARRPDLAPHAGARADADPAAGGRAGRPAAAEIARTISAETGKTITEATGEAGRSGALIRLAAFEGTQLYGDTLPLDGNPGTGQDKIGFTLRQPCGIVVAITPFNYPALLVPAQARPGPGRRQRRSCSSRPARPR